jgi:GNAT superfamily N-acetyltransferase
MTYSISTDPRDIQLDIVYPWLRDCYWSPGVRRAVVERAFANSMVVGAYRDARQIGVARVVTDRSTFAWLCDVFVDPSARGEGIATAMVRAMLEHPELATLRRWSLGTRDAHAIYAQLGFGPVDPALMMQYLPDRSQWSQEP